jgi:hypothetical protein
MLSYCMKQTPALVRGQTLEQGWMGGLLQVNSVGSRGGLAWYKFRGSPFLDDTSQLE